MRRSFVFLAAVFLVACQSLPQGYEESRISPLNEWLYRSPQPTEEDFEVMQSRGIRTVVNFRREDEKTQDWEKEKVESLGMNYVSLPWSVTRSVEPELLDQFFKILDDPKNRPVLFHCKHGRDRSGVMSVLALMRYENLSEEEARKLAFSKIPPNRRYHPFVNQKIRYFVESRPESFSETVSA